MQKTQQFTQTLNKRLDQITFNKKKPLVLKGSFKNAKYISDIDYSAYVYFNNKFIDILIHKISNLKNFQFISLNSGMDKRFDLPWTISSEWGCNFDLKKAIAWLNDFKHAKLVPEYIVKYISSIILKKKISLSDLIDIENILRPYRIIRWSFSDILKREQKRGGFTYSLLDVLRKDSGVLHYLYFDKNVVSIDVGFVDRRYTQPIWERMYKYYTEDWYKILKGYKKLIALDYVQEYRKVMETLQYKNSIYAQTKLIELMG